MDDPALRDLAHRYITAARGVAERVLSLYARAQALPSGTFPVSPLPYLTSSARREHPAKRPPRARGCSPRAGVGA